MSDNLDTKTDRELDELFAVEVAGWRRFPGTRVWNTGQGSFRDPLFTTDATAVLPWLGTDWDVRARNGSYIRVTVYRPSEQNEGEATNGSFPRAAVIALLRAKRAEKGGVA